MPLPALVKPRPLPEIGPPTVRVLAVTVIVGVVPKATAPVPRLRFCVPVKVKLPFQIPGLLAVIHWSEPVLSMVVLPEIVNVLAVAPSAVGALMTSVPALSNVPPV